jgi:hypothetical protein
MDQLGEESTYSRHMYLTCCFNSLQNSASPLFPDVCQDTQFLSILSKVLQDNRRAVDRLGFCVGDISTHLIRKVVVTYLASSPGGPPAASTCIPAGWTMGCVKDKYMRYVTSGNQLVGRCL